MRKSKSLPSIIPNYNSLFEESEDERTLHTAWNRLAAMFNDTHLETQAIDTDQPSDHKLLQIGGKNYFKYSFFIYFSLLYLF